VSAGEKRRTATVEAPGRRVELGTESKEKPKPTTSGDASVRMLAEPTLVIVTFLLTGSSEAPKSTVVVGEGTEENKVAALAVKW
jgi:hypothetical protein